MAQPTSLSFDTILTLAERESGGFGLADAGLQKRVRAMVDWINERGPYSPTQVGEMTRQIQHVLASRLHIALDRKTYPGIAEQKVEAPIFVIGFARSGTTLMHALLAEDPEAFSPLAWHSRMPSPPPGHTPACAGRINYAQHDVQSWINFAPGQLILHPYADKGAYQYIEDEEILGLDFRSGYPSLFYKIPTLDVMGMLQDEPINAVNFHRQAIQHFTWKTGKKRWVSKFATSQYFLEALFEVYPDALCVWSHRPISEIYTSGVAVRAMTFDSIRTQPMDWSGQAKERAEQMKWSIDRMMAHKMIDDPRIMHIPFHELAADPVSVVRRIHERRGAGKLSADYEQRLRAWLDDPENKVDRYGRYPYAYEPYGLDENWVKELFADYSKRFGLKERG